MAEEKCPWCSEVPHGGKVEWYDGASLLGGQPWHFFCMSDAARSRLALRRYAPGHRVLDRMIYIICALGGALAMFTLVRLGWLV